MARSIVSKFKGRAVRRRNRSLGGDIALMIMLGLFGLFSLFPLVFIVVNAIKPAIRFLLFFPFIFIFSLNP